MPPRLGRTRDPAKKSSFVSLHLPFGDYIWDGMHLVYQENDLIPY